MPNLKLLPPAKPPIEEMISRLRTKRDSFTKASDACRHAMKTGDLAEANLREKLNSKSGSPIVALGERINLLAKMNERENGLIDLAQEIRDDAQVLLGREYKPYLTDLHEGYVNAIWQSCVAEEKRYLARVQTRDVLAKKLQARLFAEKKRFKGRKPHRNTAVKKKNIVPFRPK